jgi:hypothetical protein
MLFSLVFFISCNTTTKPAEFISIIKAPTGFNSSESSLHKSKDGTIYLSWLESTKGNTKLLFSTLKDDYSWSKPKLITQGSDWFVNWADFPSISSFGENLVAHFLKKSAPDTFAYNVQLLTSNDGGEIWNSSIKPHFDNTTTEHGFVSKIGLNNNSAMAVWLDGRQMAEAEKDSTIVQQMTLRGAKIDPKGTVKESYIIDDRVCDCCQTDMAMTQEGPIVVYRDRSGNEVRDIYYSKQINNNWTSPLPLFEDNWVIEGCPVNGPAISTKDSKVAVAWFTIANGFPSVKVVFSSSNGEFFGNPINIDHVSPLGRVDIELLEDNSALVSWMDRIDGKTLIQLQRVKLDGSKSEIATVTESSESRSSGFPRMVIKNNYAVISWTNVASNNSLNVETALVDLSLIE